MIWEIDEKARTIEGLDAAGRPDPAYAEALGLLPAPRGRRALALICDIAFWLVLQLPLWIGAVPLLLKLATGAISPYGFVNHPGFILAVVLAAVTVLLTIVYSVVQLAMHGVKGMTIGKAITGIRTVNVRTLERPGFGAVLLRVLIVWASGIVPVLGPTLFLISPLFDPERRGRGWHDQAAKVWLVDIRRGLDPYDEKRMRVARKVVKAEPTPERAALPSLATPVDPTAQPSYRPGGRVSAGVLGVARPYEADERPAIGLAQAAPPVAPKPGGAGTPVLGGYRMPPAGQGTDALRPETPGPGSGPAAPAAEPAPPTMPAAPAPAPPAPQVTPAPAPAPVLPPPPQPTSAPPAPQPTAASQPAPAPQPTPQPTPAAPQPTPAAPPVAAFALRLDTGESLLVTEPLILGRNPDVSVHPGARAVALADDSRSLSKTHLIVRPADGGLEIIDCRSTNGSGLIRNGVEYGVAAGVPVPTGDGDVIRLGDRIATVVKV